MDRPKLTPAILRNNYTKNDRLQFFTPSSVQSLKSIAERHCWATKICSNVISDKTSNMQPLADKKISKSNIYTTAIKNKICDEIIRKNWRKNMHFFAILSHPSRCSSVEVGHLGSGISPRRPKFNPRPVQVRFMTKCHWHTFLCTDAPYSCCIHLSPMLCNLSN